MALGDYVFKSNLSKTLFWVFDLAGYALRALFRFFKKSPPLKPLEEYRRVLLIRLDHLGDGVFLTPALQAARKVFPNAHITLLAGPWAGELLQPGQWVDEIKVFQAPWFFRSRIRKFESSSFGEIREWMRAQKFEVGLDFRGDLRHLLWMALAGIPIRVGYGVTGGGFLLTHEPRLDRTKHEVESDLDLLRVFQPNLSPTPFQSFPVSKETEQKVDSLLDQKGLKPGGRLAVFQLTAGYASKEWGSGKNAKLIEMVSTLKGVQAAVIGAPEETSRIGAVLGQAKAPIMDLSGQTHLRDLVALLKKAAVFVGPDSGPAHLAVAMGTPCALVYSGVNDLRRWGPWTMGRENKVRIFHHDVFCSPCSLPGCPFHHECLEPITPEMVFKSIRELLALG